jgi:prephenate dehydrogenase
MGFNQIAILGVGLLGGSIGMACRSEISGCHITGYGNNPGELQQAIGRLAIHAVAADPVKAVSGADLVILCTPVGIFGNLMTSIGAALKPGAILTDVGSTKRSIVNLAKQLLPPHVQFVGSHPMVGSEQHGIANARVDLLTHALCILTPTESTAPSAVVAVETFWQKLKMRTVRMSPAVHDQLTADISHLPHALAAALVRMQSSESLQIAARGFLDTTRIAAGDSALWRDIFLDNRDNLKTGIVRLQSELQQLLEKLEAGDGASVRDWLRHASETRTNLQKHLLKPESEGRPEIQDSE